MQIENLTDLINKTNIFTTKNIIHIISNLFITKYSIINPIIPNINPIDTPIVEPTNTPFFHANTNIKNIERTFAIDIQKILYLLTATAEIATIIVAPIISSIVNADFVPKFSKTPMLLTNIL